MADECTTDMEKQTLDDSGFVGANNLILLSTAEQPKSAEAVPHVRGKVSEVAFCVITEPRPPLATKEQQNVGKEVELTISKASETEENIQAAEVKQSKGDGEMPKTEEIKPAEGDSHTCDQELALAEEIHGKTRKETSENKHRTTPDTEAASSNDKGQQKKTTKKQKTTKRRKLVKTTKTKNEDNTDTQSKTDNDSESDDGINIILPPIEEQRRFAETASNIAKVQRFQKMLQRTGLGDTMWKYYVLDYKEVWARISRGQDQGVGRDPGRCNWRGRGRGWTRGRSVELGRGRGLEDSGRGEHVASGRRL